MTLSPLVIAKDALQLLRRGTTQPSDVHLYARDAHGQPCGPFSSHAAKWTLSGALLVAGRCEDLKPSQAVQDVSAALREALGGQSPADFAHASGRRAEEVHALLETLIRKLEAAQ